MESHERRNTMTPMIEPDTGFFDPEACDLSMLKR